MKKKPEITVETRKNLTIAFWKLYKKKNIAKISIKEITDLAGYHRATFYIYFKDIYDILKQEKDELITQFFELQKKILPTHGFNEIMKLLISFYLENGERLILLMDTGKDSKFLYHFKKALYPYFLSLRKLPDTVEASIIYEYSINGILMAFNCWYKEKSSLSVEEYIKLLSSIFEKGVLKTIEIISNNSE